MIATMSLIIQRRISYRPSFLCGLLLVVYVVVIYKDDQKKERNGQKETAQKLLAYGNYREKKNIKEC